MKNTTLVGILAAPLMAFAMSLPAWAADGSSAPTTCKDGTTSASSGRGACSGHGGVQKASKSKEAADAAAEPAAPAAAPAAAGAALTCKDGTTSTASGRGACSGHGGVQKASKKKTATAAAEPAAAAPSAAPAAGTAMKAEAPAAGTAMKAAAPAAGNTNPAGATAKCKDGTYSKSQHRSGTCSKHGGVADWLGAQ